MNEKLLKLIELSRDAHVIMPYDESETTDYRAITDNRTDYVLKCMYENQFITRQQYQEALNKSTANVLSESPESNEIYPYTH